ncbi:MAG: hypothetical protein ACI82F_001815, partial [Planctomycetota bacterium]
GEFALRSLPGCFSKADVFGTAADAAVAGKTRTLD